MNQIPTFRANPAVFGLFSAKSKATLQVYLDNLQYSYNFAV